MSSIAFDLRDTQMMNLVLMFLDLVSPGLGIEYRPRGLHISSLPIMSFSLFSHLLITLNHNHSYKYLYPRADIVILTNRIHL